MTLDDFIQKYNGKVVDFDGSYGAQCVDLFRQYNQDVLNINQPKGVSGAADFWTNYPTDPNLNGNFDQIPNTATFIPSKGDVMIWNKKAGGGYGHIAIIANDTATTTKFISFDENWTTPAKCELITHDYKNVYGVLRPKKQPSSQPDALAACMADRQKFWEERDQAQSDLAAEKIAHQETQSELDLVRKQLSTEQDSHTKDLEAIASRLDATADMAAIIPAIETCLTYEDKARQLEKERDEENRIYEKRIDDLSKNITDIQNRLDAANREIDQLKKEKPESGTTHPSTSIIDAIVKWFKGKL